MKTVNSVLILFVAFASPAFASVVVSSPSNGQTVGLSVNYSATATTTTCTEDADADQDGTLCCFAGAIAAPGGLVAATPVTVSAGASAVPMGLVRRFGN